MTQAKRGATILLLGALVCPLAAPAQQPPAVVGKHSVSAVDQQAIRQLLDRYTASVTSGDEAGFATLLLNADVPFTAAQQVTGAVDPQHADTRHYEQFRQAIFASGRHYKQHFYNVRIEQDGPLAQAALDFVTLGESSRQSGYGWKVLQLLKVQGQWKIASEIYTVYPLPEPQG